MAVVHVGYPQAARVEVVVAEMVLGVVAQGRVVEGVAVHEHLPNVMVEPPAVAVRECGRTAVVVHAESRGASCHDEGEVGLGE